MAREWAIGFGIIFASTTVVRTMVTGKPWRSLVPGGIAVAVGKCALKIIISPKFDVRGKIDREMVGMYNVPSFTLARTVGGLLSWYWVSRRGESSTPLIVLASVSTDGAHTRTGVVADASCVLGLHTR